MTCRKSDTFLLAATFAAINFAVSLIFFNFSCCDYCCEFKFAATFAASFAATFLPFVLRAQVLYHVLIKMAELEKEDNIMCLLLPASSHFKLYRNN